jgi:hypothetical protein
LETFATTFFGCPAVVSLDVVSLDVASPDVVRLDVVTLDVASLDVAAGLATPSLEAAGRFLAATLV